MHEVTRVATPGGEDGVGVTVEEEEWEEVEEEEEEEGEEGDIVEVPSSSATATSSSNTAGAKSTTPTTTTSGAESLPSSPSSSSLDTPPSMGLLLRGVGVGLLGAALRPLSGALGIVASTAQGLQEAVSSPSGDPTPLAPPAPVVLMD
jgi:hypothetical protein